VFAQTFGDKFGVFVRNTCTFGKNGKIDRNNRLNRRQESTRRRGGDEADLPANPATPVSEKPVFGYARFFDDDKFDLYCIRDQKDVKVPIIPKVTNKLQMFVT
jgi:hypothetical protein